MLYGTRNNISTVETRGSTAGFIENTYVRFIKTDSAGNEISLVDDLPFAPLFMGFTGPDGSTALIFAARTDSNIPFEEGNTVMRSAVSASPSVITEVELKPGTNKKEVNGTTLFWFDEPTYSPQRHELYTYSNGTYGYPTGYNQSFYANTEFALTGPTMGTNYTCIVHTYRPNTPFGWYNGFGNTISTLLTRQHLLICQHYPMSSDFFIAIDANNTVHNRSKLTMNEQFPGGITGARQIQPNAPFVYPYFGTNLPNYPPIPPGITNQNDWKFQENLKRMGNGMIQPGYYPGWYKLKTGRELHEDYDLDSEDVYQFTTSFFNDDVSIQTFKNPFPETIVPASIAYYDIGNTLYHRYSIKRTAHYTDIDHLYLGGQEQVVLESEYYGNTGNSDALQAIKRIGEEVGPEFPTSKNINNESFGTIYASPLYYLQPSSGYVPGSFYSVFHRKPVLYLNSPFCRGFVGRSFFTGISTQTFGQSSNITTGIGPTGQLYTEIVSYSGNKKVDKLNTAAIETVKINTDWLGYEHFEEDGPGRPGIGDSGGALLQKWKGKTIWAGNCTYAISDFGHKFTLKNYEGYGPDPEDIWTPFNNGYSPVPWLNDPDGLGIPYGDPPYWERKTRFDLPCSSGVRYGGSIFSSLILNPAWKKILDIMMSDKSWQVTTEEANSRIPEEKRIYESDLSNDFKIDWIDLAPDIGALYRIQKDQEDPVSAIKRELELFSPDIVAGLADSIFKEPIDVEVPDKSGVVAKQPENTNLANPTKFHFSLKRVPTVPYFCTSISLPGWNNPTMTVPGGVPAGKKNLRLPSDEISHGEVSFKFLVNEDMSNYDELVKWFKECVGFNDYSQVSYRNWMSEEGYLIILSNKNQPLFKITFRGLFPTNISQLDFKATDTEAGPLSATVTMAFTYFELERLHSP